MKNPKDKMNIWLKAFKTQGGIALVETLVAIAILGASGAAFASALSTGSIAVNNQDAIATAQALAQTQIEVIQNAVYDSGGNTYSIIATPANYAVTISASTAVYGEANIQKIVVNVSHYASQIYVLQGYKVNR